MARNYSSLVEPKTLTANVGSSDTQITLNNVTGLPSRPYVLVLNPDTDKEEAVLVTVDQTGVTSPTLKVQRAIEASGGLGGAQTHSVGHTVKHMIVGSDLQLVHDHIDDSELIHGINTGEGSVVGTLKPQTLTNKTLTTPKINENVNLTATSSELNVLDGITATTAELNIMDGVTATTAELNTLDGITASTAELNILDGVTSTASELNILDGATLTTIELNYVDGVTSPIQTQFAALEAFPKGMISIHAGSGAPTGWFICNGDPKSKTTYAGLYAALGPNAYGTDTTDSFYLPNLKGRVVVGINGDDADFNLRGETGGWKATQAHSHTNEAAGNHAHGGGHLGGNSYRIYGATYGGDGAHGHNLNGSSSGTNTHDHGSGSWEETAAQGIGEATAVASIISGGAISGGGHQHSAYVDFNADGSHTHTINAFGTGATADLTNGNLQPYMALHYIIKY